MLIFERVERVVLKRATRFKDLNVPAKEEMQRARRNACEIFDVGDIKEEIHRLDGLVGRYKIKERGGTDSILIAFGDAK